MLKDTSITKFATLLKIDPVKLKAAIASDKEEDVEIAEDLNVLTTPELKSRDDNQYATGKKAGSKMTIDGLKKKHEVEAADDDPEKFVENLKAKFKKELDTNPDARIAEKDKELTKAKSLLKEANDKADRYESEKTQILGDVKLLSMLPNNRLETMNNDEYLALTKSAIKIETREGKEVAIRNGVVVTDSKTMDPIAPAKVISDYYAERKWVKDPVDDKKGRGGGNSNPGGGAGGKYAKLSDVRAAMEAEGINANGEEGNRRIAAAIKDNPEMDLKS